MADPTPGPFAPVVTRFPYDVATDTVGSGVQVRALAQYPGNAMEQDNPSGDVVTADLVLLLTPSTACSEYDEWLATDGLRYRAEGAPGRYRNPITGTGVTQVNLRRIT